MVNYRDILKVTLFLIITILNSPVSVAQVNLGISENRRYLVGENGKPFYWLGDTGWALFQKLDRKEVDLYFKARAKQGFSVIHTAVFNLNPFVLPPLSNVYEDMPFMDNDPTQPNITPGKDPANATEYDYWDHAEYVIDKAAEYGLYINLLPIFGVVEGEGYNLLTPDNVYDYGKFIGARFKDKTNIIWCMGGDVLADNDHRKSVWDLLARGVTEGVAGAEDYSKTLITYHVRGGHSSSEYFPDAPWLDFHMLQTWGSYTKIYDAVTAEYHRTPVRPVLHGEGAYEDGPEYPTKPITPLVVRKQAYWAIFAGGMHTYGNSNVWNFGTNPDYVSQDWKLALQARGAKGLSMGKKILEKLNWWAFAPDPDVITGGRGSSNTLNVAMRSTAGDRILVYLAGQATVTVDLNKINGPRPVTAKWIHPQTGKKKGAGKFGTKKDQAFTSPEGWEDALLLIVGK